MKKLFRITYEHRAPLNRTKSRSKLGFTAPLGTVDSTACHICTILVSEQWIQPHYWYSSWIKRSGPAGARQTLARPGPRQTSTLSLMLTSARPPNRAWEVARTVVAPPLSVVKCLWEVFVWGSSRARVCAGVGGVFSVSVSCVRVTC